MTGAVDVIGLFLEGAGVILEVLADPALDEAWDRPSVLEDQLVGGLAGHLARGGVWVVADYLDGGEPDGPVDFGSAGEYYAAVLATADDAVHEAVRARGAEIGAVGRAELARTLEERVVSLGPRLASFGVDHPVAVFAGRTIRLGDYLATRIVEQVVHLDDLARSLDRDPYAVPSAATDLTLSVGLDLARHRSGDVATLRAFYRSGFADGVLPVV